MLGTKGFDPHAPVISRSPSSVPLLRYGEWHESLIWILAGFTSESHRGKGVRRVLHSRLESIAIDRKVSDICFHALFASTGVPPAQLEREGYEARIVINFQGTQDFLLNQVPKMERYAIKWQTWSVRSASTDDLAWILSGIADIYRIELRAPREDLSAEIQILTQLVAADNIIVALDSTGKRLGFLCFTPASSVPYGSTLYGSWFQRFIWALYVWVDSDERGSGIASFLYSNLFKRAQEMGFGEIGLDVFNANASSRSFHEKAVGFRPEVQVFVKNLGVADTNVTRSSA